MKKITVYRIKDYYVGEGSSLYVAFDKDWKLLEVHSSSSLYYALNEDIAPTIEEKYDVIPFFEVDEINEKAKEIYEQLDEKYDNWREENRKIPHKHFVQWLEEVYYFNPTPHENE